MDFNAVLTARQILQPTEIMTVHAGSRAATAGTGAFTVLALNGDVKGTAGFVPLDAGNMQTVTGQKKIEVHAWLRLFPTDRLILTLALSLHQICT